MTPDPAHDTVDPHNLTYAATRFVGVRRVQQVKIDPNPVLRRKPNAPTSTPNNPTSTDNNA